MSVLVGMVFGVFGYFFFRYGLAGFFTVQQNERAVVTSFGRAQRIEGKTTLDLPIAEHLSETDLERYTFPQVRVIEQIEQKVVNRLRQVTSAIRQAGANQVDIITSAAEKEAAVEFARAEAVRPELVGQALVEIAKDEDVAEALFEALETQRLVEGQSDLTLVPAGSGERLLTDLLASRENP